MSTFTVTVRTLDDSLTYRTTGTDSASVHIAALAIFGLCGVSVKPS